MLKAQTCAFAVLICLAAFCRPAAAADVDALDAKVNFYLPFIDSQYPGVITRLKAALAERDISNISLLTAEHWHEYQQGLRAGRPGVYLAAPHFAAWAIDRHKFKPIIRLATPLSYVIATRRNDTEVFEMNDLANLAVCSQKPLNLDYLLINSSFDNSLLSADIKIVKSVINEMRRASSDCRGFALSNQQYERLAISFPDRYIRVQQSQKFNNLVLLSDTQSWLKLSASISKLRGLLVSELGREILAPMLQELAPRAAWVNARPTDYPISYYDSLRKFWR